MKQSVVNLYQNAENIPSEYARARPGSAKSRMRSNCRAIGVIRLTARVRFKFSYVIPYKIRVIQRLTNRFLEQTFCMRFQHSEP